MKFKSPAAEKEFNLERRRRVDDAVSVEVLSLTLEWCDHMERELATGKSLAVAALLGAPGLYHRQAFLGDDAKLVVLVNVIRQCWVNGDEFFAWFKEELYT